jgi:putative ABC transport system ATP-binding protein
MTIATELIRFDGVSRSFGPPTGRFNALKDINLVIRQGEHTAIVGKSGSGKSTMLNMLTGIDHPSVGTVTINGTKVHTLDESRLANWRGKNIGIVFQFFQLIPTLTVVENMLIAMDFVGTISKKERTIRAERLLEMTGIPGQADKLPASLSGGEQQRAAIARALANDPPILVADEPTGNLDSKTTDVIFDLFTGLSKSGKTVIVVTHEKSLRSDYDRIITLNDGMIVDDKSGRGDRQ